MKNPLGKRSFFNNDIEDTIEDIQLQDNKNEDVQCLICSSVFCNSKELRVHQTRYHPLQCPFCRRSWKNSDDLKSHVLKHARNTTDNNHKEHSNSLAHSQNGTWKETSRSPSKHKLSSAVLQRAENPKYSTEIADEVEHSRSPQTILFKCKLCKKRFPTIILVFKHNKKDHNDRSSSALTNAASQKNITEIRFQKNTLSTGLEYAAQKPSSFQCSVCKEPFKSVVTLLNHTRKEHQEGRQGLDN